MTSSAHHSFASGVQRAASWVRGVAGRVAQQPRAGRRRSSVTLTILSLILARMRRRCSPTTGAQLSRGHAARLTFLSLRACVTSASVHVERGAAAGDGIVVCGVVEKTRVGVPLPGARSAVGQGTHAEVWGLRSQNSQ